MTSRRHILALQTADGGKQVIFNTGSTIILSPNVYALHRLLVLKSIKPEKPQGAFIMYQRLFFKSVEKCRKLTEKHWGKERFAKLYTAALLQWAVMTSPSCFSVIDVFSASDRGQPNKRQEVLWC